MTIELRREGERDRSGAWTGSARPLSMPLQDTTARQRTYTSDSTTPILTFSGLSDVLVQ